MGIKSLSPMESAVWMMKGALAGFAAVIVMVLATAVLAPERFSRGTLSPVPKTAPTAAPQPLPPPSLPVRQVLSLDVPTPRGPDSQKVLSFRDGSYTCYMVLYGSAVKALSCAR